MIGCEFSNYAVEKVKYYVNLCEKIGVPPVGYGVAIVVGGMGLFVSLYLNSLPQQQGDEIFALVPGLLALAPFAMVQFCTRGPFAEQVPKLMLGFALPMVALFVTAAIGLSIFHP